MLRELEREEKAQGVLISEYKYLREGVKNTQPFFFPTGAQGQYKRNKLEHGRLHLVIGKHLITV